jgi:hypothetical protein
LQIRDRFLSTVIELIFETSHGIASKGSLTNFWKISECSAFTFPIHKALAFSDCNDCERNATGLMNQGRFLRAHPPHFKEFHLMANVKTNAAKSTGKAKPASKATKAKATAKTPVAKTKMVAKSAAPAMKATQTKSKVVTKAPVAPKAQVQTKAPAQTKVNAGTNKIAAPKMNAKRSVNSKAVAKSM